MIDRIYAIVFYALAISPFVERIVEMLKTMFADYWRNLPKEYKKFVTMIVGVIVAAPLYSRMHWDFVFVGLVASLGSNYVHAILSLIEEYKKKIETDKHLAVLVAHSALINGGDRDGMAEIQE